MMAVQERRLTIPGVMDKIEEACDFVDSVVRDAGLSSDAVYHCHLSVEEVLTNIVEHGYHFNGGDKSIDISVLPYPDRVLIVIADDAPPFDPLARPEPNPKAPLMDREGGGWGIFFVKKFMDGISYRHDRGRNHLILEKRIR
jgi:anti-sigma regulatory factor (Ser/Thr protein kinase)